MFPRVNDLQQREPDAAAIISSNPTKANIMVTAHYSRFVGLSYFSQSFDNRALDGRRPYSGIKL